MGIIDQVTHIVDFDNADLGLSIIARGSVGVIPVELVDSNGVRIDTLPVSTTSGGHSAVGNGSVAVPIPGTAVQLPDQACKRVYIQAHEGNKGRIAVGGSDVVAAAGGRNSRYFYKTWGGWFNINNLNLLYIDATLASEGIVYFYEN